MNLPCLLRAVSVLFATSVVQAGLPFLESVEFVNLNPSAVNQLGGSAVLLNTGNVMIAALHHDAAAMEIAFFGCKRRDLPACFHSKTPHLTKKP